MCNLCRYTLKSRLEARNTGIFRNTGKNQTAHRCILFEKPSNMNIKCDCTYIPDDIPALLPVLDPVSKANPQHKGE